MITDGNPDSYKGMKSIGNGNSSGLNFSLLFKFLLKIIGSLKQ